MTILGIINRSIELIKNEGIAGYAKAIKRYFSWHTILDLLDEAKYYGSRLLTSEPRIVKYIHGHKMILDISSGGIHKYLYLFGCYEPESTGIFSQIIPKGATVVDIGANIGYYSLIEARIAQKVYAIEPEPRNLELLRKNICLNSYEDRVEVYQVAISNRIGKTFLSISDKPNRHRLIKPGDTPHDRDIEIETITLDAFIQDKEVDVIRMDLEGAEWLVISGMRDVLSKKSKPIILFIEVHPKLVNDYGGDYVSLLELLLESNFKISHLVTYESLETASLGSYFTERCSLRSKAFEFNPPLDKYALHMNLNRIPIDADAFSVFMRRT